MGCCYNGGEDLFIALCVRREVCLQEMCALIKRVIREIQTERNCGMLFLLKFKNVFAMLLTILCE